MIDLTYFKEQFDQSQPAAAADGMAAIRSDSFDTFTKTGLPTFRTEEWKYTGISGLFDKAYNLSGTESKVTRADVDVMRLPGYAEANELVFVNGHFNPALSDIRSSSTELEILSLKEALSSNYKSLVTAHLNQSSNYVKDGIHALNGAFMDDGIFINVHKGKSPEHPIYLYHLSDARGQHIMSQPRSLIYAAENSRVQLAEAYTTLGSSDSFYNEVMEIVVAENAFVEYYKIQNDGSNASQVNTTHITQIGRSHVHTVTISLNGGIVRNNMNLVLDAAGNETHLYGLYLLKGKTHVDNHTLIDNRQPNCFSNQFYKGIANDASTAVFNGRIMVQPEAQKTNAYQSNKNILLSDQATINTKPQLEIFADDVKCSHGCTVGQLDDEALFYLRARGIPKADAEVLLLQAYASDILEHIKPAPLRKYVEKLIHKHLSIR
ncbi:Fe-S cluster assembly protein SufD [Pedobacter africanus]|uniref:Iron-regulated ABC transporter permease protein SufD n=1 Tax=Pedobacter africanus TaxID=151894 RepID=A0A1W1ZAF6_9SPHI|nr:Fe-S cluster assembly protein SufD [Pedobacter africanus]SMC45399.1 Iron-regulated ABC transporter permease protein SufD [Pedobacter africanus]